MKKILLVSLILGFGFASCNKEPVPLTKEEITQKIDSIMKVRIIESDEQSKRDLERRIKIEVKVIADSLLNAQMKQASKDTAKKPGLPVAQMHPFSVIGRPPQQVKK
jgi:hypothetical protein